MALIIWFRGDKNWFNIRKASRPQESVPLLNNDRCNDSISGMQLVVQRIIFYVNVCKCSRTNELQTNLTQCLFATSFCFSWESPASENCGNYYTSCVLQNVNTLWNSEKRSWMHSFISFSISFSGSDKLVRLCWIWVFFFRFFEIILRNKVIIEETRWEWTTNQTI